MVFDRIKENPYFSIGTVFSTNNASKHVYPYAFASNAYI